jgi:hypothetical protein
MNILCVTQGRTLGLFHDVAKHLQSAGTIETAGFYVTDSKFFDSYSQAHPELLASGVAILKEWEILATASVEQTRPETIRDIEARLGDPTLWNAIVADRRLFLGPRSMREQNYPSRYSHDQLLAIARRAAIEMESLFDRAKPSLVVGFICVTIGDYMAELVAKQRGIPFLNLRPTRIRNFFYGGESVHEPSARLEETYQAFLSSGLPEKSGRLAMNTIEETRSGHALYEGVIPLAAQVPDRNSGATTAATAPAAPVSTVKTNRFKRICRDIWMYQYGKYRFDNHYEGHFAPHWFNWVKKPVRLWLTDRALKARYISDPSELEDLQYAFYPMHKEPEVTLLVYGKPFLNQVEIVRNLARSLPMGMNLVIKEHPMAIGYRAASYYRKLLEIPNVVIADPTLTSRDLLTNTKLVTVIGGSIGLEALVRKIPVLHFGNLPFSFLPDGMISKVGEPANLADKIHDLLENHQHDEAALTAYYAAVIESSVSVDFYSVIIGRGSGWLPDGKKTANYHSQIGRLAGYIVDRSGVEISASPESAAEPSPS